MNSSLPVIAVLFLGMMPRSGMAASSKVTEDVSVGFLPLEWVTSTLRKNLSPEGRYQFAGAAGPVRITDGSDKIATARRALDELQKAPAIVPVELNFITTTLRQVPPAPASPPSHDVGFPVPSRFSAPRILGNPGGPMVVIPSQPTSFTTRKVGSETIVSPAARENETKVTRRYSASIALGKPAILSVLRESPDAAALRGLAVNCRAVPESEPAWTSAGTELLLQTELSDGHLLLNVTPQIVIPGPTPRHIPLSACAASVLISRGAPINTGTLPQADAEFYRLFLGATAATKDAVTALRIAARVEYVGGPVK